MGYGEGMSFGVRLGRLAYLVKKKQLIQHHRDDWPSLSALSDQCAFVFRDNGLSDKQPLSPMVHFLDYCGFGIMGLWNNGMTPT